MFSHAAIGSRGVRQDRQWGQSNIQYIQVGFFDPETWVVGGSGAQKIRIGKRTSLRLPMFPGRTNPTCRHPSIGPTDDRFSRLFMYLYDVRLLWHYSSCTALDTNFSDLTFVRTNLFRRIFLIAGELWLDPNRKITSNCSSPRQPFLSFNLLCVADSHQHTSDVRLQFVPCFPIFASEIYPVMWTHQFYLIHFVRTACARRPFGRTNYGRTRPVYGVRAEVDFIRFKSDINLKLQFIL